MDISLRSGEVHMLLGENGAGKSTIVGALIGSHSLDQGSLTIRGRRVEHFSPTDARRLGLNAVLQDFSLAPSLTVAENYFLGCESTRFSVLKKAEMRRFVNERLIKFGVDLDVNKPVSALSRAEQQLLEITRAVGGVPGALILDEPTAALSHGESERLFSIVDQLRHDGWAVLYITHRLEEMRRLGDRVTVVRNGELIGVHDIASVNDEHLIREMVGRPLTTFYPEIIANPGEVALQLNEVRTSDGKLDGASIRVRRGEVVGIGGLVGCGKAELGRVSFGLIKPEGGVVQLKGESVAGQKPAQLLAKGVVYLPQDRRGEALALNRSIGENIVLEVVRSRDYSVFGWLRAKPLERLVQGIIQRLDIRPTNGRVNVESLSGGNQQKVVLGRALTLNRDVYIFDEPTSGIDVSARLDFYNQIKLLCEAGAAVLLITSDLQELIHLSHRIYVMHGGKIAAELVGDECTEETVVRYAFGDEAVAA
ncbi:sugar ABC transporter ATP-binding protein [Caballeronia sp. LjRoot34]|uniref:sugar ABC transporter ATP-binding protein n=1 Tax=Caballeronia sp. LjRoot34 TaxID=3342325 RepID=UPI003ECFB316